MHMVILAQDMYQAHSDAEGIFKFLATTIYDVERFEKLKNQDVETKPLTRDDEKFLKRR